MIIPVLQVSQYLEVMFAALPPESEQHFRFVVTRLEQTKEQTYGMTGYFVAPNFELTNF